MDSGMLRQIASLYCAELKHIRLLGGFDNNVFGAQLGSREVVIKILRCTDSAERAALGEMDWVMYLSDYGVGVPKPVPSAKGNHVEKLKVENCAKLVQITERAKGVVIDPKDPQVWNNQLFNKWGAVMGRMHFLARRAKPHPHIGHWNQNEILKISNLGQGIERPWFRFQQELRALPTSAEGYGIIHNDLHHQNFFVDEGNVIVMDFGDCEHGWFAYDIAVALYHAVQMQHQDQLTFADRFIDNFLQGYSREYNLDHYWICKIPFFLNWRQIFSYVYLSQRLDMERCEQQIREGLKGLRRKIEDELPYLEGFSL